MLEKVPDEFDLYLEEGSSANDLYYFAEILVNHAILEEVDCGHDVRELQEEILEVADQMLDVAQHIMLEFSERSIHGVWDDVKEPVEFEELTQFFDVRVPWFTDTSAKHNRHKGATDKAAKKDNHGKT